MYGRDYRLMSSVNKLEGHEAGTHMCHLVTNKYLEGRGRGLV
jgi:hypothetical protein